MAIAQLKAYDEFIEFITSNPSLQDVANFFLSDDVQSHIQVLRERNQQGTLTPEQVDEMSEYMRLEYIIQQAKVRAYEKLDSQSA